MSREHLRVAGIRQYVDQSLEPLDFSPHVSRFDSAERGFPFRLVIATLQGGIGVEFFGFLGEASLDRQKLVIGA